MISLFKKELTVFFSSITGYSVIIVFLLLNSLFLWVFAGPMNVLESGYSSLETVFAISPWLFLFLAPAVTMRLFSEEKRSGTIEPLLTRPITDLNIVLAKYFSGLALMLFALLPTLLYFLSIYQLGNPVGNIDTGGTWGSYIGLFFLAASFVAIGLFASSLTENQIVAFVVAILIAFLFYFGPDPLAKLFPGTSFESLVLYLGIGQHYQSMSRGVLDSRDLVYFLGLIAFFILLTKTVLQSRKW